MSTIQHSVTSEQFHMRREAVGVTREWFADELDVSVKAVKAVEDGVREVPVFMLSLLDDLEKSQKRAMEAVQEAKLTGVSLTPGNAEQAAEAVQDDYDARLPAMFWRRVTYLSILEEL